MARITLAIIALRKCMYKQGRLGFKGDKVNTEEFQ